jgi:hypothetical protein
MWATSSSSFLQLVQVIIVFWPFFFFFSFKVFLLSELFFPLILF